MSKLTGGKSLPAELLDKILARTDGVALFVEELTRSILESGELKDLGKRYDYIGASLTVSIPAHPARLSDGALRSLSGGEGNCTDRRGHRARVQLRAGSRGGGEIQGRS